MTFRDFMNLLLAWPITLLALAAGWLWLGGSGQKKKVSR